VPILVFNHGFSRMKTDNTDEDERGRSMKQLSSSIRVHLFSSVLSVVKLACSFFLVFFLAGCPSSAAGNGKGNGNGGNGNGGNGNAELPITRVELSPNAKRLMNYLSDNYGSYMISGQMDTAWSKAMDMIDRVYTDTGKYPALKGFDLISLPFQWDNYGKDQIDEAIDWWEGKNNYAAVLPGQPDIHGIVAFCWHWRMQQLTGNNKDFYTKNTSFRIPMKDGKLDQESAAFQIIKDDLDKAAALLKLLKDQDIPVLWRPLHEASGGWFWWGASGARACAALWEYMYDYLANVKGLDNLIWVWNGQHYDWFPDPATAHIISYDVYLDAGSQSAAQQYSSATFKSMFNAAKMTPPEKNLMVALSENGAIPDPDWSYKEDALWSWFMTWNDSNGNTEPNKDNFWIGGYHNTAAHKTAVYNHAKVITLDELPDLTQYRLE